MSHLVSFCCRVFRPLLDQRYRDIPRFHAFCRDCENFGRNWSCPDEAASAEHYLDPYEEVLLLVMRWRFAEAERDPALSPLWKDLTGKQAGTGSRTRTRTAAGDLLTRFSEARKEELLHRCLELESAFPGILTLSPGACPLCAECAKIQGQPCRHPDQLRFSLEALGYDVGKILREQFSLDLEWSGHSLPEHFSLMLGFALPPGFTRTQELEAALARA